MVYSVPSTVQVPHLQQISRSSGGISLEEDEEELLLLELEEELLLEEDEEELLPEPEEELLYESVIPSMSLCAARPDSSFATSLMCGCGLP